MPSRWPVWLRSGRSCSCQATRSRSSCRPSRRACTWCSVFAMRRTALPSPTIATCARSPRSLRSWTRSPASGRAGRRISCGVLDLSKASVRRRWRTSPPCPASASSWPSCSRSTCRTTCASRAGRLMAFAEVVVDTNIRRGAQTYTYSIPSGLEVAPGQRVVVPFGSRQLEGVVFRLTDEPVADVRPLLRAAEPLLLPHQLELARWIAEHYAAPIKDAVALFLPPTLATPRLRRIARLARGVDLRTSIKELTRAPRQLATFEALLLAPLGIDARALPSEDGLRGLVQRGLAEVLSEVDEPPPLVPETAQILPLRLTEAQREALDAITHDSRLTTNESRVCMLHGVTGSGKTEVYLQAIADALERGQRALLLVPEISLTPQTIARCASRFPGRVAVLHSALTPRQRYGEWRRIGQGSVDVVIGPRSALFAPLRDLGLIVIDEEHDWTYKQEQSPRYHARETAIKLASLVGAKVILGTATPDLGSYHRAQKGIFTLLTLPERIVGPSMPPVRIVDMRQELQ